MYFLKLVERCVDGAGVGVGLGIGLGVGVGFGFGVGALDRVEKCFQVK